MKFYFCFIHVRPEGVPELRMLACDDDDCVPASLVETLAEWPDADRIEVMEGDRLVLAMAGAELAAARSPLFSHTL